MAAPSTTRRLFAKGAAVSAVAILAVATSAGGSPAHRSDAPAQDESAGAVAGTTIARGSEPTVLDDSSFTASANPAIFFPDPTGVDVGMPDLFPDDRISGYDMNQLVVTYDDATDELTVTIDTYVIAGDADGDGDPATTGPELAALAGIDEADFAGGETFAVMLDIDEDGRFDVIAGVSADADFGSYVVAKHNASFLTSRLPASSFAYGDALPLHNAGAPGLPNSGSPDLTVVFANFSLMAGSLGLDDDSLDFGVNAFMGSVQDAGIGEDFIPGPAAPGNIDLDARIGDRVWFDENLDGDQDAGEPGAGGLAVLLLDDTDGVIDSVVTDRNGAYEFAVRPGTYRLAFERPLDTSFTKQGAGSDSDSDVDPSTGFSSSVTVEQGEKRFDIDAGLIAHQPSIDLEKATNGVDSDAAPGELLVSGSTATFTYVVTNTGNIDLTDVMVTDDRIGVICTIAALGVGGSADCDHQTTVEPGPYANIGSAVATPVINGERLADVSDDDPSHHSGTVDASVDIEKSTNGEDADTAPGPEIEPGSPARFVYSVVNTGNVPLVNVIVTDDHIGQICVLAQLVPGDLAVCDAATLATPGPYRNVADVVATPMLGQTPLDDVTDSDASHHHGRVDAAITIEKATNGEDADDAPGAELPTGSTATFEYVVVNAGNVPLVDLIISDDVLGTICGLDRLEVGESKSCSARAIVQPGPYMNVGSVEATPLVQGVEGDTITADDPSHHHGSIAPGIDIEKLTNGIDADDAPGVELLVGDVVTWTYEVVNSGNIDLIDVAVTDDIEGLICTIGELAAGSSAVCETSGIVVEGPYTNVGSVTGVPLVRGVSLVPVGDVDPSNHVGKVPGPVCVPNIDGPLMWAGKIVEWDSGLSAAAGSVIRIVTSEPDSSPGQPHEQVYVKVGDDVYGPTPVGLGELLVDVVNDGPLSILHYSVVTGDVSNPNSVAFSLCGTGLNQ